MSESACNNCLAVHQRITERNRIR